MNIFIGDNFTMAKKVKPARKIPSLRIIELATRKIEKVRNIPRYQVKEMRLEKERLWVSLDWVQLRDASLRIEVGNEMMAFARVLSLKPKVVYGQETEFFHCRFCCDLPRLFPGLVASDGEFRLTVRLLGILPRPPHSRIRRKIARFTVNGVAGAKSRYAALMGMCVLCFLAILTIGH